MAARLVSKLPMNLSFLNTYQAKSNFVMILETPQGHLDGWQTEVMQPHWLHNRRCTTAREYNGFLKA